MDTDRVLAAIAVEPDIADVLAETDLDVGTTVRVVAKPVLSLAKGVPADDATD
ncbi:hypothetical protein [Streptomyces sp. NPDC005407]|uniref:hypothetical protein n=1 Tax=Streptomyces sp. NPDC005407 TaxID=3155340 RepID=UPI0033B9CA99